MRERREVTEVSALRDPYDSEGTSPKSKRNGDQANYGVQYRGDIQE